MWLQEAIKHLQDHLGKATRYDLPGVDRDRQVFDRPTFNPPPPQLPVATTRKISTLQGFADYVNRNPEKLTWDNGYWIHVAEPHRVTLCRAPNANGEREFHVKAECETQKDADWLDRWISQEDLLIALLGFAPSDNLEAFVESIQSITRKSNEVSELAGGGQKFKTEASVGRTEWASSDEKPVELAPFRTFCELEQPLGRFIFRVTGGEEQKTQVKLVPVPDLSWSVNAVNAVAEFLDELLDADTPPIVR